MVALRRHAKKVREGHAQGPLVTKTSIMLGCGEEASEVIQTMQDALDAGVEIFTLGAHLQQENYSLERVEV